MRQFYFCRHGLTLWNQQGLLQGQLDSKLTEQGIIQAQALANKAKDWQITAVYCSPLGRAKHTAQICAETLALPLAIHPGLQERSFGDWQGEAIAALPQYQALLEPGREALDAIPVKGAESQSMCLQRFSLALDDIASSDVNGNILLISHGHILESFARRWQPLGILGNAGGFYLSYYQRQWQWGAMLE